MQTWKDCIWSMFILSDPRSQEMNVHNFPQFVHKYCLQLFSCLNSKLKNHKTYNQSVKELTLDMAIFNVWFKQILLHLTKFRMKGGWLFRIKEANCNRVNEISWSYNKK